MCIMADNKDTPVENTVELQWLEHFRTIEICLRKGLFELMSVNHSASSRGKIGISFRFSLT